MSSDHSKLRKFISTDSGNLFCAICEREAVWEDCPIHPDDHFSAYCPKCGIEDKDCEMIELVEGGYVFRSL